MKKKRIVVVAIAALVALVGTGVLVTYVRGAEDRALAGEELVAALVTTQQIPAGTPAEELADFVETEEVPAKIAPEGTLSELDPVAGLVTTVDILAGETVQAARFVEPDQFSARPGSVDIPEGHLEVTIAMSQEQFIGGIPVPGDHVAVLASGPREEFLLPDEDPLRGEGGNPNAATMRYTQIVLQQALVTNVQGNPLPESTDAQAATERVAPADGSLLITLALDGLDTERLIFFRNDQSLNASLHMALHHDDQRVDSQGTSVGEAVDPNAGGN
ncbi:MAG: RcpC/CpaB family pilus assembly protein [Acidimicrobiales bacterium]|nr:RcpC/CpaB family pilus assembly protein [Acidimicrobiales bacterium]